jgi:hypothetical protein
MYLSTEEAERVNKLPKWASDLIARLLKALADIEADLTQSLRVLALCQKYQRRYADANAAILELLSRAGQAGVDWARVVADTLGNYEIFPDSEVAYGPPPLQNP